MAKRYWIAALGNFLACLLATVAMAFVAFEMWPLPFRLLGCIAIFFSGWAMHRFQAIMCAEYEIAQRGRP